MPITLRSSSIAAVVVASAGLAAAATAAEPLLVKRQTVAGKEVLVRGFAEFDSQCRLVRVQTIGVATPPRSGTVETRPGPVVIGPNWVGGGNCVGTTLQGVNVYYVPAAGFTGSDRFSLDVGYTRRNLRAEVEVTVR
jgi:hypothetical protein